MKRASCQTRATLEQFYAELETADQDEINRGIGRAMRDLLTELRRDVQQEELARQRDA